MVSGISGLCRFSPALVFSPPSDPEAHGVDRAQEEAAQKVALSQACIRIPAMMGNGRTSLTRQSVCNLTGCEKGYDKMC